MVIKVNGVDCSTNAHNLASYIDEAGYDRRYIAIEHNGMIVSKACYDSVVLQDDDILEIVTFVGGG